MTQSLIYLDTDISLGTPGAEIDDFAALLMLLRCPRITLAGIGSVFGNAPVEDVDTNLARLLNWLGKADIPTASGAGIPLAGDLQWFADWRAGYGPTPPFEHPRADRFSAQLLIDLAKAHPRQITVLAIGPLTNLALALQTAPEIAGLVKGVIAMGGSFHSQSPEFNVHCDPRAARLVLGAGWPVTLLGMEITRRMFFTRAEFASLPAENSALRLFSEQAVGWIERVESMGWEQGGCSLHDAAAAAYLLHPEFFNEEYASVEISEGETQPAGTTTLRPAEASDQSAVCVVTEVDAQKCKALIYASFTQEVI